MTSAYRRLSVAAVLAVLVSGLSHAPPARADEAQTQRAKELFQQGTTLFNIGEFDKAIEAWQQGYKERPDPGFLYNIGQAYRLKGDGPKAIFFYRGYLRNSPKAANRADVEAKIAALQKGGAEEHVPPATTPPSTTAPAATPPPVTTAPPKTSPAPRPMPAPVPARPAAVAPPPAVAPPLPLGPAPAAEVVTTEAPAAPTVRGRNRRVDLYWGLLGFNNFTSGLNIKGSAPAQYAFSLGGGLTFGGDTYGPASFRLGALLTRTSLQEGAGSTANTLGFTSLLLEPSVRLRLADHRLYLTGALGIGALFISNVNSRSVVLATPPAGKSYDVNGTQAGLELRPAATLHFLFTDWIGAFASPALAFTPKKENYQGALGRFELMFGVAFML
jgi:hypothetical protein